MRLAGVIAGYGTEGRNAHGRAADECVLTTFTGTADRSGCRRGRSKASFRRIPYTSGSRGRPATRGALQLP